ncbi:diacylglycerol kinase eta isoform X2 [Rhodnius prolixus]|uniref:diacylglycerol kinase eta isoform X2 n=1 Tax=Rhodnius prolixus TaxID=13249 RepID=UPI003D18E5BE
MDLLLSGQLKNTSSELHDLLSGRHSWLSTSHARPTYCNICRDALSGVTSHGLSCSICKYKVHKRCSSKAINNCKWTTLASVGKEIIEDKDGNLYMPHQWMEGNLPVSSKCAVCDKTCGSVLRLQDWRCLWCKETVHTACRPSHPEHCPLGPARVSVVPPTALHSVGSDDAWEAIRPQGCSPLLVFVNSKSGDNQGVKFLKRFKQILNPAQVFDLIISGPYLGLKLFKRFDRFRILVCSGDGSVGWVLSEIDKLNITNNCQVGVLPLGTGNDLARVLGWGASCDDDTNLIHLLDKYEKATTKILDRWSIMTFERPLSITIEEKELPTFSTMDDCESAVVSRLIGILESEEQSAIIHSARVLCETVKYFIQRAEQLSLKKGDKELNLKYTILQEKLDQVSNALLEDCSGKDGEKLEKYLHEKTEKEIEKTEKGIEKTEDNVLQPQECLKKRANSLKKVVHQLIQYSGTVPTEQNLENILSNITGDDLVKSLAEFKTEVTCISPIPCFVGYDTSTELLTPVQLPVPKEFADSRRSSAANCNIHASTEEDLLSTEKVNVVVDVEPQKALFEDILSRSPGSLDISGDETNKNENGKTSLGSKLSEELANICHIDSSETSDDSNDGPNEAIKSKKSEDDTKNTIHSVLFKYGSYETIDASNLISTSPDEEDDYEDFSNELGLDNSRKCSIAHFIEGNDIARRSIKCRHKNLLLDDVDLVETKIRNLDFSIPIPTIQISHSENESISVDNTEKDICKSSSHLDVVQVRIKGSNNNIRGSVDGMNINDFQDIHRKSLALSETDDEEFLRFHNLRKHDNSQNHKLTVESASRSQNDPTPRRFSYDCCRKLSAASPCTVKTDSLESGKSLPDKKLPIINPLVRLPSWPNITGSGIVSKVLLANADALCAAAVPLMDPQETILEGFRERCVMNNYFGIGIDAKITLDFHQKREEHPEKCRSRAKNYMWYGVLGSKEWLQKTYKNLEQKVHLECDGQRIPLPSLQGIVILNIPSFMGGTNFWGGTKEGEVFLAPSMDDQILEVVAVFGSMQMAASRLINLQHHRIAQCRTVQINIIGEEGVPIQVDGEAWIQPPGMIRIIHKNKMRMLSRNRALEMSLRSWQEKQRMGKSRSQLSHSLSQQEIQIAIPFVEATNNLVKCVKELIKHPLGSDLYELANRSSSNLEKINLCGKVQQEPELRQLLTLLVHSARELHDETYTLLKENAKIMLEPAAESHLNIALSMLELELRKCHFPDNGQSLVYFQFASEQDRKGKSGKLSWLKFRRDKPEKADSPKGISGEVKQWGVDEVGAWLDSIHLGEYADIFAQHDIRGREVVTLTRRDLKDLGISKVGHVKRLLHAVNDLSNVSNE